VCGHSLLFVLDLFLCRSLISAAALRDVTVTAGDITVSSSCTMQSSGRRLSDVTHLLVCSRVLTLGHPYVAHVHRFCGSHFPWYLCAVCWLLSQVDTMIVASEGTSKLVSGANVLEASIESNTAAITGGLPVAELTPVAVTTVLSTRM
jgi:hypothetical protein